MKKLPLPALIIFAFAALLWLPNLFTRGMFVDGVYDALMAHNLAQGIGSFWAPQTADYMHPQYWDNPQLGAYFQSLWIKVFGDHYWVDKLYSLFCALVQLALIASVWRINFAGNTGVKNYAWLPCFLFMLIPLTSWGYSSNLLENTMSIFTTASVIAFLLFIRTGGSLLLHSIIGGALIFLALITKGPVALFPLAVPAVFMLFEGKVAWTKLSAYLLVQLLVLVAIFAFVFNMPAPNTFLHNYLDAQLLRAIKPDGNSSLLHFGIFLQLLLSLLPLLVVAVVSLFVINKNQSGYKYLLVPAAIFILIGLSASAPIALSAKQNKHYLIPSLPLFALGFACLILPLIQWLENKLQTNTSLINGAKAVCLVVTAGCFIYSGVNAGNFVRDKDLLTDLEKIDVLTKGEPVLRTDWGLYSDWALRAYLNRLYDKKICMPGEPCNTNFYLTKSNERGDGLSEMAQKIYTGERFDLYEMRP